MSPMTPITPISPTDGPRGTVPRIVIVGAGPAGVRAAEACVQAGLRPVVVDEGPREGGQIYRRPPPGFQRPASALYGADAPKAQALHTGFDALRPQIELRSQAMAWNLSPGELHLVRDGRAETLPFDALLICSGATDRLMPVPGWQRAGCYSLGAAQIALKSQACAVGERTVFLGSGPLLYLVASQYLKAGAGVAAVLDTAPLPRSPAAVAGLLARPALAWRGIGMIARLRLAGVPVWQGVTPVEIDGNDAEGVRAVVLRDARGRSQRITADAVAMGWHLRAETQLADLARCEFAFEPQSRQWLPRIDTDGRSSSPGVYLAGDGARILGADGAEAAGRLAALAALADLGHAEGLRRYTAEAPGLRATLATMDRFRAGLLAAFPWPHGQAATLPDEAVVCRCEGIRAGELRACVREQGSQEVNRAKAFTRVGMGRCQGRYCGHAGAEIIAAAAGVPIEQVGRLRTQAPVKPLVMSTPEAIG